MKVLATAQKDQVLADMMSILAVRRDEILAKNKLDLDAFDPNDRAMYDRLIVNDKKIEGMVQAIDEIRNQADPIGRTIFEHQHPNGMHVYNKTAPFGTILIIYESRPDVTIEAAVVAFKSGNKIILKGGKEANHSNAILVSCWHKALEENGLDRSWITQLSTDRTATQAFLSNPPVPLDLIVPRGGEGLIKFVKDHARCAVLISGRGNNFLYVAKDCDWDMSLEVIKSSKVQKISACNALDKVLIDRRMPDFENRVKALHDIMVKEEVEVWVDKELASNIEEAKAIIDDKIWGEEFLAMKICIGGVSSMDEAIEMSNTYSGGHSATIMTADKDQAERFMIGIDAAAVYHNASTRFTDGGQLGVGAELAISTDKLHHRGPLGLDQLVTNKWFVYGQGQIRG